MVVEATMICIDNSEWMRNDDYSLTRVLPQTEAVKLICEAKAQMDPENTVGVMTMGHRGVRGRVTPTSDLGEILAFMNGLESGGEMNLAFGIRTAEFALQCCQNKKQQKRIIVFVGSPIQHDKKTLELIGKKLKENSVALDIVNFGEEDEEKTEKLEALLAAVNNNDNSHIVHVPSGPNALSDVLISTPIFTGDGDGGSGLAAAAAAAGGASAFEYAVDPDLDPELDVALRVSMEEERARQEAAAKKAAEEAATQGREGEQPSGSQDATITDRVSASATEAEPEKTDLTFGVDPNVDPELALALIVSMEEERARQEAAAKKAAEEAAEQGKEGEQPSSSQDATITDRVSAPATEAEPKQTDLTFGVDPNLDLELAQRVSMEEERARQEAAAKKAAEEAATQGKEGEQLSSSQDATITDRVSASATEAEPKKTDLMFGVDPDLGLELAQRVSMEEGRGRQEAAAKKAVEEASTQGKEGEQTSSSQDATITDRVSAPATEAEPKKTDLMDEENAMLLQALAMSMGYPAPSNNVQDPTMSEAATDDPGATRRNLQSLKPPCTILAAQSHSVIPMVNDGSSLGERTCDIFSKLLKERIVCINGEINADTSQIVIAQLLNLESESPFEPIQMYINSPGGDVTAGLAIYDTMQLIKPSIETICVGQAASMASLLVAAGTQGERRSLPNAEIMIHQPSQWHGGQAKDLAIYTERIVRISNKLNALYADHTRQPIELIEKSMERDNFMTPEKAMEFGIIDEIICQRDSNCRRMGF